MGCISNDYRFVDNKVYNLFKTFDLKGVLLFIWQRKTAIKLNDWEQ